MTFVNSLVIQIFYYDFQHLANQYVALFQEKHNGKVNGRETKNLFQYVGHNFNRTLQTMTYLSQKH